MKFIDTVDFVLDNGEAIRVSSNDVLDFTLGAIKDTYTKIGRDIVSYKTVEEIAICLLPSADNVYHFLPSHTTVFQRLLMDDISLTAIRISFRDGDIEDLYVSDLLRCSIFMVEGVLCITGNPDFYDE